MSTASSTSRSRAGSKRRLTGRPTRAVAFQWMRRSGSPGWYGRTPANSDGSSIRPCGARAAPGGRRVRPGRAHGHRPGHHAVRRGERAVLGHARLPEQVRDLQPGPDEAIAPAAAAHDLEAPGDPLEPADAPGLREHREPAVGRRVERHARDVRLARDEVVDLEPGEREGLGVADDEVELDPLAPRHAPRGEVPFVGQRPQPVARPQRAEHGHQPQQHADGRQGRRLEQHARDEQADGEDAARAHGRDPAPWTGGTATDSRTASMTSSAVEPCSWRSMSRIIRWPRTAGTSALASSGTTKSRPAR